MLFTFSVSYNNFLTSLPILIGEFKSNVLHKWYFYDNVLISIVFYLMEADMNTYWNVYLKLCIIFSTNI